MATSGLTAYSVYVDIMDRWEPDERLGVEQGGIELHGGQTNVTMNLDEDLAEFFRPGQRYKVTITREEASDGD